MCAEKNAEYSNSRLHSNKSAKIGFLILRENKMRWRFSWYFALLSKLTTISQCLDILIFVCWSCIILKLVKNSRKNFSFAVSSELTDRHRKQYVKSLFSYQKTEIIDDSGRRMMLYLRCKEGWRGRSRGLDHIWTTLVLTQTLYYTSKRSFVSFWLTRWFLWILKPHC